MTKSTKDNKKISSALISVYNKEGLTSIVQLLKNLGITIYSTGGTQKHIENMGVEVRSIEGLTTYPSILDGRVKTLHPKVFGGILARSVSSHQQELNDYQIPRIDLVIVDLYPFEETLLKTSNHDEIIEKIDIGGISLIRAAAKNYNDVIVIPSRNQYKDLYVILSNKNGISEIEDRKKLAAIAFKISSNYDQSIQNYFESNHNKNSILFDSLIDQSKPLRYGENPHQKGYYHGNLDDIVEKLNGKDLSYNNLVDIDAAISLMAEFKEDKPTVAILKHTNVCGIATRDNTLDAWTDALAGDNISAFGGIIISNSSVDLKTAENINNIFYEVLISPNFEDDALRLLKSKKKRILLKLKEYELHTNSHKTILNGIISQEVDRYSQSKDDLQVVTDRYPSNSEIEDLLFANKCAKHLKSNTIIIANNKQLQGMGCGQTSRVDACKQAIEKAQKFGFDLSNSVLASDAFFPFPDCVEMADQVGIKSFIQPGGSINDKLSIDYCNNNNLSMVFTGIRHFKH